MKKVISTLILLLATVSFASSAFASSYDTNFYTSNQEGGKFVDTFTAEQDIWLHVQLPHSGLSFTSYWTTDPVNTAFFSYTEPTTETDSWYNLNDIEFTSSLDGENYAWSDIVKLGPWNIAGTYAYPGPGGDSKRMEANFTINAVPEPISAGLFLIGGAALAITRRKKA